MIPLRRYEANRLVRWARAALLAAAAWLLQTAQTAQAQNAPPMDLQTGEVKLELDRFGTGNTARAGDWAGIRVRLQDTALAPRNVIIRVAGFDADGDTPWYERAVATNPGVLQATWLYVRLPFNEDRLSNLVISAYEATDAPEGGDAAIGYRPGRLLGRVPLVPRPGSILSPSEGLLYVMGPRTLGLTAYSVSMPSSNLPILALGHEVTQVATITNPGELPDQWQGLANSATLIWGSGEINELRADRARAVRDWVNRGGHLVVVLPPVGQAWTSPNSNDLYDMMPAVSVLRREGVNLGPYRPLLSGDDKARMPDSGVVHSFQAIAGADPAEAIRILNAPDGSCVVVRRLVGAGAVTLVGLDLNASAIDQRQLIDADVFWHRVLGRRGITSLTHDQAGQALGAAFLGMRSFWQYDQDIPELIAQKGQAAAGVALGFVVFVLYWLVAGPLGFGLLKMRKLTHHAWLAFVLAAAVFTATSWGGATLLKPSRIVASHVTFLDHVYGQPVQRARGWFNILIPGYAERRIAATDPAEAGLFGANLVTAWEPFSNDAIGPGGSFLDVRGYPVDGRTPDAIAIPTRATSKQVQVDWAGGPRWRGPAPLPDESGGAPVIRLNAAGTPGQPVLSGTLVHDLPGTLTNIYIVVVRQQRSLNDRRPPLTGQGLPPNFPQASGNVFLGPPSGWPAGVPLTLDQVTLPAGSALTRDQAFELKLFIDRFRPAISGTYMGPTRPDLTKAPERFAALALFPYLAPPEYGPLASDQQGSTVGAYRTTTHTFDLGRWFTQPCVIIIGIVGAPGDPAESPIPLSVDGRRVPTRGMTVVRWVYPLPDNPPEYPAGAAPAQPDSPAAPQPADQPG